MPKAKPNVGLTAGPDTEYDLSPVDHNLQPGSAEQEAIWQAASDPQGPHLIVKAVAGSGKTYTGVELCKRLPKSLKVAFVAFNKHIQIELSRKLSALPNVQCLTYHGLGLRALQSANSRGAVKVDQYKVDTVMDGMNLGGGMTDSKRNYLRARVRKLVSLAKQCGAWDKAELEHLVDHYDVDLTNIESETYQLVPAVLKRCLGITDRVDFDDMIWMPKELGLKPLQYDFMLVDEAQDTNLSQQWLALNSTVRLVVIGDPNQAIYGFRGADSHSMERMHGALVGSRLGVKVMTLTATRRCPKSHVRLAQKLVPGIQALPDAPEGVIRVESTERALGEMRPGDLVVCRVNGPLVGTAYKLLRRGVKAVVRGRDIGEGLNKLIAAAKKRMVPQQYIDTPYAVDPLLDAASAVTSDLCRKYERMGSKGQARLNAARERYECLLELSSGHETVQDLERTISRLFEDFDDEGRPIQAVVLGTVHRTKGLEANRVYVLMPEKIPHPMAKQKHEVEQEYNLGYVVVTRAKYEGDKVGELIFVGGESPLFMGCASKKEVAPVRLTSGQVCPECGGTGYIVVPNGPNIDEVSQCPYCSGDGRVLPRGTC